MAGKGRKKPKILLSKKKRTLTVTSKSPVVNVARKGGPSLGVRMSRKESGDAPKASEGRQVLAAKGNVPAKVPKGKESQRPVSRQSRRKQPDGRKDLNYEAVMKFHKLKKELLPILFTRLALGHPDAARWLRERGEEESGDEETEE